MTDAIEARLPLSIRRVTGSGLALLGATLVAVASLVPLGFIAVVAVTSGWEEVVRLVFRPKVGELLLNTLWLELLTVPLSVILGVTLAWLTERTRLPGAGIWAGLMVAPLGVPAFVQSYAWSSAFPSFHGLAGVVTIAIIAYFPFVYLPVAAQLRRLDPALEDNAASLGLRPTAVFFRVVLPQLRLSICAGALLVGLHLLGEYGLFVLMRYDTFATAIVDQFQSVYDGPAANLLGGVLVLCCLVLLGGESLVRGDRRYARVGSGSARRAVPVALGAWTFPAVLMLSGVAIAALGVTFVTLGRWLWYGGLGVWKLDQIGAALEQTVLYAVLAGVVATALAMPMAWIAVRAPGRWQRVLEACHLYVGALPGIIVALALVAITVRVALPLYQTVATLIFAYALIFLPRALTGLRSSIAQVPVELERAAMNLGRPPVAAVWQVTMRLASPGIAASVLLVALGAANELTATLMLAPNGTRTLATKFWALTSEIDYAGAAPYAVLLILVSMPLTLLLRRQSNRAIGQ
ncbi:ABC transporter permease [Devosia sp. CN2-171]|uniref:ABC transporter permease n=1 Tax=Devosia sp. CN2-171 TaxID=3400909 RepID=UPI003BF8BAE5